MSMDNYVSLVSDPTEDISVSWRRVFGIMIHDVREFMARSVEEAAYLAGMEPSEWAALEDGNIMVDPDWLWPMADALGISHDQMQNMIHFSQFAW